MLLDGYRARTSVSVASGARVNPAIERPRRSPAPRSPSGSRSRLVVALAGGAALLLELGLEQVPLPAHQLLADATVEAAGRFPVVVVELLDQLERPSALDHVADHQVGIEGRRHWQELARTSSFSLVFADFAEARAPTDGPIEVPLPAPSPLRREWVVLCDAPDATACLSAWERPRLTSSEHEERRFEAVWTVEPAVVRDGTRAALGLASEAEPELAFPRPELLDAPAAPAAVLRRATALTNRVVAYLQAPPA